MEKTLEQLAENATMNDLRMLDKLTKALPGNGAEIQWMVTLRLKEKVNLMAVFKYLKDAEDWVKTRPNPESYTIEATKQLPKQLQMELKASLSIDNDQFKEMVIEKTPYIWVFNKEKQEGRLAIGKAWVWQGCDTIDEAFRVIREEKQLDWNTMAAIARMECEIFMDTKLNNNQ